MDLELPIVEFEALSVVLLSYLAAVKTLLLENLCCSSTFFHSKMSFLRDSDRSESKKMGGVGVSVGVEVGVMIRVGFGFGFRIGVGVGGLGLALR